MIRALWLRLGRIWGWQKSQKARPRATRMPRGWWMAPAPFDRAWRKDIKGRPFS